MQDINISISTIILGIIIGFFLGYFIAKIAFLGQIKKHRKSAVSKSRNVILGQMTEQLAPILPNFPYNYKDAMFIGKGVDYIIFDGLSTGNLKQIIFLEIKTGKSSLNKNERQIQKCIQNKFVTYNIHRL